MSSSPRPRLEPSHHSARLPRLTRPQLNRNLRVLVAKGLIRKFTDPNGVVRYETFVSKVRHANA